MASVGNTSTITNLPQVRLKISRRSSHPWIFQKMVEKPAARLHAGSVVDILDRDGQWVGRGFYNGHSRIALRLLTTDAAERIDQDFFARRLERAITLRRQWLGLDAVTDAYRLVHSEGDQLSGLVVDRFGATLVLEFFAAGMFRFRSVIQEILAGLFPNSNFYWFAEEHVQKQESFDCRPPEPPSPAIITEHGVRFRVAPGSKHKTGFFLDQRDNRKTLAALCASPPLTPIPSPPEAGGEGRTGDRRLIQEAQHEAASSEAGGEGRTGDRGINQQGAVIPSPPGRGGRGQGEGGRRVLDLCCNTGGFAVYAKVLGGADEVVAVDLDEDALDLARQNANLNQARIRFVQADLFPWLRDILPSGERFDIVVLDPSKQTRDREAVNIALKRYLDMNRLALQAVAPGGIFLTCSCTGLVSEEAFLETLRRAAWQAGRTVQILKIAGAAPDHPYLIHVPEGRYLKAVFCRVE